MTTQVDEFLQDEKLTEADKTKLKRALVGEVYQGHCPKCSKLAVRIFQPRRGLDTIMKKHGMKGVMKQCGVEQINERILVDMPSFNMILTGKHREADSYNLSYTSYNDCKVAVMITDNPRGFVWHLFSRLRAVRMACLINNVSYAEVKAWFDALPVAEATYLISKVIDFVKITDQNGKLSEGPWFLGWLDTEKIYGIAPDLFADDCNGDPLWDTCLDPIVADNMEISRIEYSTEIDGDNVIDVPKFDMIMRELYSSKSYDAVVEPVNNPGKLLQFKAGVLSDEIAENDIFPRFKANVPLRYWSVEASRHRPGLDAEKDPSIVDLETR